jgi:phenylalanyl-tRNA synthetase beta chain
VRRVVESAGLANLARYEFFDLYRGKGIPDGSYAIGLSFTFQSADRTLSDEEANAARDDLLSRLSSQLGAAIRS